MSFVYEPIGSPYYIGARALHYINQGQLYVGCVAVRGSQSYLFAFLFRQGLRMSFSKLVVLREPVL